MSELIAAIDGKPVSELRVVLRRGAAASTFEVLMPAATAPQPDAAVTLAFADTATSRDLRQFRVTRVDDLGNGLARVHGADVRTHWSQRPVHARINVPVGDGTVHEGGTLDLSSALERLFAAAGEPPVSGFAPAGTPRGVICSGTPLNEAIERACAACGVTFTIGDDRAMAFAPDAESAPAPDATRLIESATGNAAVPAAVTGGAPREILRITNWQAVLPGDGSPDFPEGGLFPIADVLNAWGITEKHARQAALGEAGFEKLLPTTASNGARRLEILRRHAFRMFRAETGPWVPVGGVNADGTLAPPRLEAAGTRPQGFAPDHASEDAFETHGLAPVRDGFELDCARGLIRVQHPPYDLSAGDATLQSRSLVGSPRLGLTVARLSTRPPFRLGDGDAISAPHLVAVYDNGEMLNRGALTGAANELMASAAAGIHAKYLLAGADAAIAVGMRAEVAISADSRGLLTRIRDEAAPAFVTEPAPPETTWPGGAVSPAPGGPHQPINLWRAGPLVLRASGTAPETESALAAEAVARDARTNALEFDRAGPLAFPFFLQSLDTAKHGRWFFVAGVEADADGKLRVLGDDDRHEPIDADNLTPVREKRPQGLRGLLVSLGDDARFVDAGPLVSDARGRDPGACSNLVADLEGPHLSETRRGGLQYLTVLALSPVHRRWVPALNLRDGDTQNDATRGRGLFAEADGRSLGRLAAHNQGGPMMADAPACEKHAYGSAADDGLYRECAGHISTEAFFKVPGDPVHDAPLAFTREPFAGGVPPWPVFEAQIKYDAQARHRWDHKLRPGLWRIQYRVPFLPEIPPTWRPPILPPEEPPPEDPPETPRVPVMILPPESIEPAVSEYEIWAPSHDWLPPPSEDTGEDLPMRGPAISSEGWAFQQDGVPDPAQGGGCIFLPPNTPLGDAQADNGQRRTFMTLHPRVLLAFGKPHHGLGRVHSGWQAGLNDGDLEFTPLDADAEPANGPVLRVHRRSRPTRWSCSRLRKAKACGPAKATAR